MTPLQIFLRGVWTCIRDDRSPGWVRKIAELPRTNLPLGDFGEIVRRMLGAGVPERDIARFARIIGYETAFGMLYFLGDSTAAYEGFPPGEPDLEFNLRAVHGETEETVAELSAMHESLLMADPNGREMRPGDGT
jgi:hypothetical protein